MKTLLLKPFEIYSEYKLLLVGVFATILGSLSAYYFNVRYDGVLDVHIIPKPNTLTSLLDNIINCISLLLPLTIVGKISYSKTRIIDLLTTVFVARIPFYILPIFNINNTIANISKKLISPNLTNTITTVEWFAFGVFTLLSILMLIWFVTLLYNGYKTATNAKGTKAILLFIVAILIAEALSKYLLSFIS